MWTIRKRDSGRVGEERTIGDLGRNKRIVIVLCDESLGDEQLGEWDRYRIDMEAS